MDEQAQTQTDYQEQIKALEERIKALEAKAHDDHTISAEAVDKIAEQVKVRIAQDLRGVSGAMIR